MKAPGGPGGAGEGPTHSQGGPKKVHRKAEEGAVSALEKEGRKRDRIKEWGPGKGLQRGLGKLRKEPQRELQAALQKGPQMEPRGAREIEKRKEERKTKSKNRGPKEGLRGLRKSPQKRP
jgi:hypothetical protein